MERKKGEKNDSNLSGTTKNPLALFSKAEISRRICSHAGGWGSDLLLRFCMGLSEQLHLKPSCSHVWEAVLIGQKKNLHLVVVVRLFEIPQRREKL